MGWQRSNVMLGVIEVTVVLVGSFAFPGTTRHLPTLELAAQQAKTEGKGVKPETPVPLHSRRVV